MGGNNEEECVGLAAFKRNKYFYGKLLTVRDFEDEQSYINKKRYLMNRTIHGIGLVCGLEVSNPKLEESGFKIYLSKGVALDCCGHEIVVSQDGTKDVKGERKDGLNYIYLKCKEELTEPVPVPANASSCEEICCGSRILESFELEFGDKPAEPSGEEFIAEDLTKRGIANDYYKNKQLNCPVCQEPRDPKVFLAVIKKNEKGFSIDETETKKYRSIVYNNPMLYDLLSGHLTDFENPHKVTAEQVKALMSVNEVGNAEDKAWVGNINLESGDDTIGISPKVSDDKIDLKLNENSVDRQHITVNAVTEDKIAKDAVISEKIKNGAVTAEKIVNGSIKDEKIAEDANINEGKIRHLSLVYENLKERSLKCIVDSFTEIYSKFGVEYALKIAENFKKALNEGYYKDDDKYIGFIKESDKSLYELAEEIKGKVPEEGFDGYITAVKMLIELLEKKEIVPVKIASAVEEVCFYAKRLGTLDYEDLKKQIKSLNKEIDNLTNNSIADALHRHSKLVGRDGSPDPALSVDNIGNVGIGTTTPKNKLDVEGGAVIGAGYSGANIAPGNGLLVQGNVGIGMPKPDAKLDVNGFTKSLGISVNNATNTGVGRGLWLWSPSDSNHVIYSANPKGKSPANKEAAKGYFDANHRLRLRTAAGQGFLFENNKETALVDIDSDNGRLWTKGAIYAGNSDLYFTRTDHDHTGIGNTKGYAAIENAKNYDALMILGRAGTSKGRYVRLWDYLQVNGGLDVTGEVIIKGNLGTHGFSPKPKTRGWGGGIHTWDIEAEGTIWSAKGYQSGRRDLAENYLSDMDLEHGDVVCLDGDKDRIVLSDKPNDVFALGVISTAPGFLLDVEHDIEKEKVFPVALCGRVPCKVVDENGPIKRGDLLTSSSTHGHAMKAKPIKIDGQEFSRPGTIIGKALGSLESGKGVIDIFVFLM